MSPFDTLQNCWGGDDPPTGWISDANSYFAGGASGFVSDMVNIAALLATTNSAFSYMPGEVSTVADQDYFGAIACRESNVETGVTNGQYLGMFQLSTADFQGILGSGCTATAFTYSGCDGLTVAYTQDVAALYYCENRYGGNPYGGWYAEAVSGWW